MSDTTLSILYNLGICEIIMTMKLKWALKAP